MVRQRVRRTEPCAEDGCGSKRFYIDDDGFTYCERGHRQSEHGTVVTTDTGELVLKGKTHRKVDSDGESIATARSGLTRPQAQEQYLLCLQLVLRKQIAWLVREVGLPAKYEELLKDLWALRIQQLRQTPGQDLQTDDEQSRVYSSQTDGETTGKDSVSGQADRHNTKLMNVLDNVALLYVGILLLRLPVSTADLCCWIRGGELLYYFSAKVTPVELRVRLPGYMQRLLEPSSTLTGEKLQAAVVKTLTVLDVYGMYVPPVNSSLLLYRWVRLLALPIEVFQATTRLANTMHEDFHYQARYKRSPEVILMSYLIISTKLLFPSDGPVCGGDGVPIPKPDWHDWQKEFLVQQHGTLTFEEAFAMNERACLRLEVDQLDQYLDWYQENIADDHVREGGAAARQADFRRAVLGMFPAKRAADHLASVARTDNDATSDRSATDVVEGEEVMITNRLRRTQHQMLIQAGRSGSTLAAAKCYRRYRTTDDLDSAPQALTKLYELAAQHSGVALDSIVRTVYTLERQLEHKEIAHALA